MDWMTDHRDDLLFDEVVEVDLVAQVTELGYADDLTDEEIEKVGRTPFSLPMLLPAPRTGA